MDLKITRSRELSIAHLSQNPFDNVLTLKMLSMFPSDCATTLYRDDAGWVCRTELDAKVSAWDRSEYPRANRIVLLDGNSPSIMGQVLRHQPTDLVVYKVHDPWSRSLLGEDPRFSHVNSFHSYSDNPRAHENARPDLPVVERHAHYDDEAAARFAASGYVAEEFRLHLDRGARWFAVRENERIASFCLAFQIFERIWEVGGVLTLPEYRRKGFAKAVVSAALGYLHAVNRMPRYQLRDWNSASRRLAEALGLEPRVVVDHFSNTRCEKGFTP